MDPTWSIYQAKWMATSPDVHYAVFSLRCIQKENEAILYSF